MTKAGAAMRAWRRVVAHRRVILNLTDGSAIEGVIWDEQGDLLVIRGGVLHETGDRGPVEMDGEIVLDRARVRFAQVTG